MKKEQLIPQFKKLYDTCVEEEKTYSEISSMYYFTILVYNFSSMIQALVKLYHHPRNTESLIQYIENRGYFYSVQRLAERETCSEKLRKNLEDLVNSDKGSSIMDEANFENPVMLKKHIPLALKYYQKSYLKIIQLWLEEVNNLKIKKLLIQRDTSLINDILSASKEKETTEELKKVISYLTEEYIYKIA